MQIYAQNLKSFLAKYSPTLCLIHGGEPLQTLEAVLAIRIKLNELCYTEVEVYGSEHGEKIWEELLTSRNNLGLFAAKKVIEIRLANLKLGREGTKILCRLLQNIPSTLAVIIVADKLTPKEQKSAWVSEIKTKGLIINANQINKNQLPSWIRSRLQQHKLTATTGAINLLAHSFEGNILSLAQTIEKLKLYYLDVSEDTKITEEKLQLFLTSSAKFSVFDFTNALLIADTNRVFHILTCLKQTKVEPGFVLWAVTRELKTLALVQASIKNGNSIESVCSKQGIWQSQIPAIKTTISKFSQSGSLKLPLLLQQLTSLDALSKNIIKGNFWDSLQVFCLNFLNINSLNLEDTCL